MKKFKSKRHKTTTPILERNLHPHAAGLLRKSFRPADDIVALRSLLRHRSNLLADSSRQIQLMQKALTEMNLHLHHVLSDLDGLSGMAIINALIFPRKRVEGLFDYSGLWFRGDSKSSGDL
jgi:hypothetical protein